MGKQYYMAIDYSPDLGIIRSCIEKETEQSKSEVEQVVLIPQGEKIGALVILRERED